MRIFQTREFEKFAKSAHLSDAGIRKAAQEVQEGLCDAQLSGNLYKKRIAIGGKGKRGSLRTILVYRREDGWIFFVYGFKKNEMENIDTTELTALKLLGKYYSAMSSEEIEQAISVNELREVSASGDKGK